MGLVMAEMKAGYKQIDIGVIPEDWDVFDLGSIAHIKTGSRNNQDKSEGGTYPFYVRSSHVERINSYSYDCEAILIPGEGGIGSIFHYINGRFDVHQRVYAITKFSNAILGRYTYYYLAQHFGKHALQNTVKATVDSLRLPTFKTFQLAIPKSKEEQKQIATALSDVDGLIESLEQLIVKKRDMKTAAMQQLLTGKKRLPGFGTSPDIQETTFGSAPKDWIITTLQSICTFENGDRGFNYPSKSDFQAAGIPFVNAGHLKNKKVQLDGVDFITQEKFDQLGGGKFKVGDILFCLRGSLGKYAVIKHPDLFGAIASSLIIIRPKKGCLNSDFFEFYLESEHCERMIDLFAGGAAQPNLGGQDLGKFFILLPPTTEEQKAIAAILSDMDTELNALEQRLAKARSLKTGMMQELLTGKTRFNTAKTEGVAA